MGAAKNEQGAPNGNVTPLLPDYANSIVTIFADDLKLISNTSDRKIIDKDLENLKLWEKRWLSKFNIDKCNVDCILNLVC